MTKTTSNTSPAPARANKSMQLQIEGNPEKSADRRVAEIAAAGIAGNSYSVVHFGKGVFGELSLADCVLALKGTISDVKGGDLSSAEAMLTAQAAALNAMFCELARRAAMNMGEHLSATESYMRLALKAQGQCRATLETLAAIKNPPVVFARQANISHGPQQVNNGPAPACRESRAGARGGGGIESLPAPDAETALVPTHGIFPAAAEIQTALEPPQRPRL